MCKFRFASSMKAEEFLIKKPGGWRSPNFALESMKVLWSSRAIDRAVEQAEYIRGDKPQAAELWLNDLFDEVEKLSTFPQLGRVVPELNRSEFREIDFRGWRVIYLVQATEISIVTVRHSRRLLDLREIEPE